jgi:hypothetical protein
VVGECRSSAEVRAVFAGREEEGRFVDGEAAELIEAFSLC